MPTIARIGPYRVYFYSHDLKEPAHVHIDREASTAKYWLSPVILAYNIGFKPKELRGLQRTIEEKADAFLEKWNEYFSSETW